MSSPVQTSASAEPGSTWQVASAMLGAFFAFCVSWMVVLPLFAGPDEPANFIKSAAVIRGEWVGESIIATQSTSFWSTYVDIDPRFGSAQQVPWCFVGQPQTPACDRPLSSLTPVEQSRTDMGRYPALGFIPSGFGTLIGPTDGGARAARLTSALTSCALLALSGELLRRRKRSLAPLLVAVTPGVLFLASVTSPSGLEISAAVAAWIATWIAISEQWHKNSTITVFVAAASILVVARPAGAVVVAVMLLAALVADHRAVVSAFLRCWRQLLWLGGAVVVSGAWYVTIYDKNFGVRLEVESRIQSLSAIASHSIANLPRLVAESIGNFGWLDTPSPTPVIWAFIALSSFLVWRALESAGKRLKSAILVVIFAVPVWHTALNFNYQNLLGTYGVQGRHLTPFLVGIPLAAVTSRSKQKSDSAVIAFFVLLNAWCVLTALRRYSLGTGGDDFIGFLRDPSWIPPLGMTTTLLVIGVAHVVGFFALRYTAGRMER